MLKKPYFYTAFREGIHESPICCEAAFYMKKTRYYYDEPSILLAQGFFVRQEEYAVLKAINRREVLEFDKKNFKKRI